MPGNYSRIKIWSSGEILTAADLNGEFNNEINNAVPASIDDYSATLGQMQTQTNPYPSSSASQATSLAGEMERVRYKLAQLMGTTYWYEDPQTTLALLTQSDVKMHIGLEYEGKYGGASSTTDVLAKLINQGTIINAASLTTADLVAADIGGTDKKFGNYAYICGAGNIHAFSGEHGNPIKGSFTGWFRNLAAGDYIAYNPLLGVELLCEGGAGHLRFRVTEKTAATESTKTSNTIEGSATRSGVSTFANVTAKWRLNDEGGASTDFMQMEYGGSDEGTQLSSQDIDVNAGDGGIWFFGAKKNDPTWDHFYAASGLPTAHSDAWSSVNSPTGAVSNGVLNLTTSASTAGAYQKTSASVTGINLADQTFAIKMKINQLGAVTTPIASCQQFNLTVRDDSLNRSCELYFSENRVFLAHGGSTVYAAYINPKTWHTYWVTSSGSPSPTTVFYIDGVAVYTGTNSTSNATANDLIRFGDSDTSIATGIDVDIEYVAYADTAAAPVAANSQGNLDSIAVISGTISDVAISTLQNSKVSDVFGSLPYYGPHMPPNMVFGDNQTLSATAPTSFVDIGQYVYYQAGDGVTEFSYVAGGQIDNSVDNTIHLGIDIDNDLTGSFAGTQIPSPVFSQGTTEIVMVNERPQVLTTGLHEIRPAWAATAGNLDSTSTNFIWWRKITKASAL